jgi:hypothetical protein
MFIQTRPVSLTRLLHSPPAAAPAGSHRRPMERLNLGGFLLRLLAATLLVVLTWNPSAYSYAHWLAATFPKVEPLQAIAGLLLLAAWGFFAHATWRSLGTFGVLLATGLCIAIVWLFVSWGWIRLSERGVVGWLADAMLAILLAIGVSWSLVERRVTGQVVVDEGDRR